MSFSFGLGLFGRLSVVMGVLRKKTWAGGAAFARVPLPRAVRAVPAAFASDTAHTALPARYARSARGRAPLMRCPPLRGGLVCRLPPCATRSVGSHAPRAKYMYRRERLNYYVFFIFSWS